MIRIEQLTVDEAMRLVDERVVKASVGVWAAFVDNDLVAVGGVARNSLLGQGELWLKPGPFFTKHKRAFFRVMRRLRQWVVRQYPVLMARVDEGDERLPEHIGMRFVGWDEWPDGRRWKRYEI